MDEGAVFVYLGSSAGVDPTSPIRLDPSVAQAGAGFGFPLSSCDADGDGSPELVVGSPTADDPERDEGLVLVFGGWPLGLVTTLASPTGQLGAELGFGL